MESFFTKKMASHCNWLPRSVTAPSLSELKENLDNTLDHISVSGSFVRSRELDSMDLTGHFQAETFQDIEITVNRNMKQKPLL